MKGSSGFLGDPPGHEARDSDLELWKQKYPPCTRLEIAGVMRRFEDPEDIDQELRRRTARYLD